MEATSEKVVRRHKRASELNSAEIPIQQKDPLRMPPLNEAYDRTPDIIKVDRLDQKQAEALAFSEEPIKIIIHRSTDKLAGPVTDLVAVNGIHAEILFKNGWVPIGYLPRGTSFITKRKYVERMAQSKRDGITTLVVERDNEDPQNYVERTTTAVLSFTVLEDRSPKAEEWLTTLINMAA